MGWKSVLSQCKGENSNGQNPEVFVVGRKRKIRNWQRTSRTMIDPASESYIVDMFVSNQTMQECLDTFQAKVSSGSWRERDFLPAIEVKVAPHSE